MSMKYAYFPGCSAKGSCSELDISTHQIVRRLGIEIVELTDAGCTGAREFRAISRDLHLAANARILARAEQVSQTLMVVCDTGLLNLVEVNQELKKDPALLEHVNGLLADVGLKYRGTVEVKHLLWILLGDLGRAKLKAAVRRPLTGLRVAPYYGCHMLRPHSVYGAAVSDDVSSLEDLITILGGEAVEYAGSTDCCGFHVVVADERVSMKMAGGHLQNAVGAGAACMVTPCPLCHTVMDSFQPNIEKEVGRPLGLPVLHLSQLVGLALGLSENDLKLGQHVVDAVNLLQK